MATITTTFPTLQTIMDLARVYLNDFQAGATGTPGEGQITTNTSPQTLPALNSSIRDLYRELRNVGSPSLLRDNVLVNLPANGATGPTVQTYLSQQGYFDGLTLLANPKLPSDLMFPLEMWEQQTGSGLPFIPMMQPQAGLPSVMNQGFSLQVWEWRGGATFTAGAGGGDALFFVGVLSPVTIRIRYIAALTQFVSPIDFPNVYVPIMDSEDVLAYKVAYKIAAGISGITPPVAALKDQADEALASLRLEIVRRAQEIDYHRAPYSANFEANYRNASSLI